MPGNKEDREKEISAKYAARVYHEESRVSGFLHVRALRIRNLIRAWRSEQERQGGDTPEERDHES
jgi:hypothetical protein